jgi:hypothetical protein
VIIVAGGYFACMTLHGWCDQIELSAFLTHRKVGVDTGQDGWMGQLGNGNSGNGERCMHSRVGCGEEKRFLVWCGRVILSQFRTPVRETLTLGSLWKKQSGFAS